MATRPPHPRRAEAVEMVRRGKSFIDAAQAVGVSTATVRAWCKAEGVESLHPSYADARAMGPVGQAILRTLQHHAAGGTPPTREELMAMLAPKRNRRGG